MAFDPNTGLPWGTNPFKVTSRETYEPLLPPSQLNSSLSSSGMNSLCHLDGCVKMFDQDTFRGTDYCLLYRRKPGFASQFNIPFSSIPNHGQDHPPSFASSTNPMVLNPPLSTLPWPVSLQEFDFSLFHGTGYEEEKKVNATCTDTLFPNLSASYDPLSLAGCFEGTPTLDMSTTVDPIDFTTTDFDHLLAKMNRVGVQPPKCATPPPREETKVLSAPPKRKSRSGFSQATTRPFPESPTKEAVSRKTQSNSSTNSPTRANNPFNLSHANNGFPPNPQVSPCLHMPAGSARNSFTPLASRNALPAGTFASTPFSSTSMDGNSQAGTCSNQRTQQLPPLPISPLQTSSTRSDSDQELHHAQGIIEPRTEDISTLLTRPSLSAPSQLVTDEKPIQTDDIPVFEPYCLGTSIDSSPSPQRGAVHGFSSDFSQISPKSSITNFHADLSAFSNKFARYNNPFCNNSISSSPGNMGVSLPSAHELAKIHRKSKSLTPQTGKNRRQMSATTPTTERKTKAKSLRNKSLQESTPSKPSRNLSINSASTPAAIFVNFTARDSKKLLNGVAPSGSSKRKKTLVGNGAKPSNNSACSTSDVGGDAIKKRRLLSSPN